MYLSSVIFRLWKHIFCIISVKCSSNWEDMGTFSLVSSLVCLAPDIWVTALCQAGKLLRSVQRGVELSLCLLMKAMLWGIEIAVGTWRREPLSTRECTQKGFQRIEGSQRSFLGLEHLTGIGGGGGQWLEWQHPCYWLSPRLLCTALSYLGWFEILSLGLQPLY